MPDIVRPLTEEEAALLDTIVWVGQLPCGCRPFSVVDSIDQPMGYDADEAFGLLLAHATTIELYTPDDARRIVKPCSHNVAAAV